MPTLHRDDRGVTAIEYVVILSFIALMVMPAAIAAGKSLWGTNSGTAKMGSSTSVIGRGPYNYPDGGIPNTAAYISTPDSHYMISGISASNGFLTQGILRIDSVTGAFSVTTVPFHNGVMTNYTTPEGSILKYGGALPGDPPPVGYGTP